MSARKIQFARASDGQRVAFAVAGTGPFYVRAIMLGHIERFSALPPFRAVFDHLVPNYTVVDVDVRGQGLSAPGEFGLENWCLDLEAVFRSLGIERAVLDAATHGCGAAALFATRHPELVSHLILEGPYLRGDDIFQESLVGSVRQMRRHDFDFWIETIHRALGIAPEFLPNFLAVFHELGPNGMDALDDFTATIDLTKILPEVRVPTLVLGFDQPGGISATMSAEVAALIPAAEFASGPNPYSGLDAARASIVEPLSRFLGLPDGSSAGPRSSTFRTILFTDVVASTPLLTQLRDQRMREVMRDHDAVMTAAVTGHGGRVVKTIGDAFMAEFAVPSAAVEAAIEAQRQIREKFAASDVPVRLRIGINAGEPIEEAGDLHGASVVIAKRLESAAETNGILVSDVVKQMVTGKDFDFEDRGLVELKGFEEPVRAWAVRWE